MFWGEFIYKRHLVSWTAGYWKSISVVSGQAFDLAVEKGKFRFLQDDVEIRKRCDLKVEAGDGGGFAGIGIKARIPDSRTGNGDDTDGPVRYLLHTV